MLWSRMRSASRKSGVPFPLRELPGGSVLPVRSSGKLAGSCEDQLGGCLRGPVRDLRLLMRPAIADTFLQLAPSVPNPELRRMELADLATDVVTATDYLLSLRVLQPLPRRGSCLRVEPAVSVTMTDRTMSSIG